MGWVRQLFRAKYNPEALRQALSEAFGSRRLGDSRKRLAIPSFNVETGEVHVWKTAHHPRLERDYTHTAVEVALSTGAAPTYFPTYKAQSGTPLIDGVSGRTTRLRLQRLRRLVCLAGKRLNCEF